MYYALLLVVNYLLYYMHNQYLVGVCIDTGKRGIDNKIASNKPFVFPCGLLEAAYFNVAKKETNDVFTVSVRILA